MNRLVQSRVARLAACTATVLLTAAAGSGLAFADGMGDKGGKNTGFGPGPVGERTIQPLKNQCATGEPQDLCRNIGVTDGWYEGKDVKFLYTQNFFCDTAVTSGASNGCEVGEKFKNLPPGTASEQFVDPLFIPVPLFSPAPPVQCPTGPCIDHPDNIDLSRLAGALGKPADQLKDVPLPGHDHIIADRNMDRPEWWPVYVVGVTNPESFKEIEKGKDLATLKRLAADPNSGVTAPIPTNVFLWFQTLAGTDASHPVMPIGPIAAGAGSTQGVQHAGLIAGGASALAAAAGTLVWSRRRRSTSAASRAAATATAEN
ncbi:hypothetical protein K353_05929 [Kitasatospora sp. SolWspMP-SS2h]|uniref:hypothetical protein n=1 Tax=Kitasatospora sp. SolWspMP-SS2h TaxID=1305729 RepID=UPI000DBF3B37|nr:hypothetical protein [Kitasatospora sp. SolWspMP-SS2h]RAJ32053.1 hypothetical protein K353_05929 [Kitasatospora sp. SolWspMP-SS2h]